MSNRKWSALAIAIIPDGPYPLRYDYEPPPDWDRGQRG